MTGQVKEEILTRWLELGLLCEGGKIRIDPFLLDDREFLEDRKTFEVFTPDGKRETRNLNKGELAFTFCQVPFVYSRGHSRTRIKILRVDGSSQVIEGPVIDTESSREIFMRTGRIKRVEVILP